MLAFARIESRFQNGATSPVGARGLMQLMPETAAHLGRAAIPTALRSRPIRCRWASAISRSCWTRLDGNLLELGGAYNAGPRAVDRWRSTKAGRDDPLLFVESIPVAETRSYVKRLMEYHWMYRRRFGQDAKSLDETARGQWPIYRPVTKPAAPARCPSAAMPMACKRIQRRSNSELASTAAGDAQSVQ